MGYICIFFVGSLQYLCIFVFTRQISIHTYQLHNYGINLHSRSKCLVWVKKCCHIWFDQNFDPSLLTKKLWPFYMRMKQKKIFFFEKKNSKTPIEKKLIFQNCQFSKKFCENFMDWSLG